MRAGAGRWCRSVRGSDIHYEVALDPEPEVALPVPVDAMPVPSGELLPVVPEHLRTVAGVRAALERQAALHWHRARYHGIRSPRYFLLVVVYAVAGVFKVIGRQLHWWWLLEQHGLRSEAAASGDSREWARLHKQAQETRKIRGGFLAGEVVVAGGAVAALVLYGPWWAWVLAALVVVPLLARHGRPADNADRDTGGGDAAFPQAVR